MSGTPAAGTVFPRRRKAGFGMLFGMLLGIGGTGAAWASEPPCPAASLQHLNLRATRTALEQKRPITIVAFGSSSTEGAGATAPDRTYPARLQAYLRAHWPGASVTVLNRGVGGQTADKMLARLEADVLAARPTLVIWQAGANAALRGMDPATFGAKLDDGVRRITATGADVVLMDNQVAPRMPTAEHHSVYDIIVAGEAEARNVSLFSRTDLMLEWRQADHADKGMIGPDGLHHTDRGYACVAAAFGRAIVAAVAEEPVMVSSRRK